MWKELSIRGRGRANSHQKQLTGILDDVKARIVQKQAIHNDTLDRMNGAGSREEAIKADKDARAKLGDLERGGNQNSQPSRPANVPEGFVHRDGPNGKGWYKPDASTVVPDFI